MVTAIRWHASTRSKPSPQATRRGMQRRIGLLSAGHQEGGTRAPIAARPPPAPPKNLDAGVRCTKLASMGLVTVWANGGTVRATERAGPARFECGDAGTGGGAAAKSLPCDS